MWEDVGGAGKVLLESVWGSQGEEGRAGWRGGISCEDLFWGDSRVARFLRRPLFGGGEVPMMRLAVTSVECRSLVGVGSADGL